MTCQGCNKTFHEQFVMCKRDECYCVNCYYLKFAANGQLSTCRGCKAQWIGLCPDGCPYCSMSMMREPAFSIPKKEAKRSTRGGKEAKQDKGFLINDAFKMDQINQCRICSVKYAQWAGDQWGFCWLCDGSKTFWYCAKDKCVVRTDRLCGRCDRGYNDVKCTKCGEYKRQALIQKDGVCSTCLLQADLAKLPETVGNNVSPPQLPMPSVCTKCKSVGPTGAAGLCSKCRTQLDLPDPLKSLSLVTPMDESADEDEHPFAEEVRKPKRKTRADTKAEAKKKADAEAERAKQWPCKNCGKMGRHFGGALCSMCDNPKCLWYCGKCDLVVKQPNDCGKCGARRRQTPGEILRGDACEVCDPEDKWFVTHEYGQPHFRYKQQVVCKYCAKDCWQCARCSLRYSPKTDKCSKCSLPRDLVGLNLPVSNAADAWSCTNCSSKNAPIYDRCVRCGLFKENEKLPDPRPKAAAAAEPETKQQRRAKTALVCPVKDCATGGFFDDQDALDKHLVREHDDRYWSCGAFQYGKVNSDSDNPFKCASCQGPRVYGCPVMTCPKVFQKKINMLAHVFADHPKDGFWQCWKADCAHLNSLACKVCRKCSAPNQVYSCREPRCFFTSNDRKAVEHHVAATDHLTDQDGTCSGCEQKFNASWCLSGNGKCKQCCGMVWTCPKGKAPRTARRECVMCNLGKALSAAAATPV
jgi:hypothetical protein